MLNAGLGNSRRGFSHTDTAYLIDGVPHRLNAIRLGHPEPSRCLFLDKRYTGGIA